MFFIKFFGGEYYQKNRNLILNIKKITIKIIKTG